ncbi:hypothetical protein DTO013E5_7748 [Penicillium roqueforti]|nr:uncharacterized protein LCP9604111_7994 [Penicillium roqueforti]KAF9242430.1 hypothetical protein LCP9604111_7994 [Penicillium roqueforti]KAI2676542.1 hypothetical protein CBS147355_5644 [Penicillium roqueforti]KAI2681298.1 hypothetical protein LCP963914a_6808 [Penicillium roqueforti]KAI2702857.1 hypothetical protein CBS147372_3172 [Penicillium roqueforti]KAI2710467.1 hypothetical protein CBS147318_8765 [Penicillium roqueforti]
MGSLTTNEWRVEKQTGFDGLHFSKNVPIPDLGPNDVLVRFHAASINYRDLIIATGEYRYPTNANIIPGSDGAGTVEATGSRVSRFHVGDKVITLFNQGHHAGPLDQRSMKTALGGLLDGTFRQRGVFSEEGLVAMPPNLSFLEASTLTCAGLTAWNALYGSADHPLRPGDVVLTQGSGGVSLFGIQFAKAAGATVIATTSSDEKAVRLKELGADHVINYKTTTDWGKTAKSLTPEKAGVSHILEVGGPGTLRQSLAAIKIAGLITGIGYVSKSGDQPTLLESFSAKCTVQSIVVGSRAQFEQMNRAVEAHNIHPVMDQKTFRLEDLKSAYQYMSEQRHFGKVGIKID